MEPQEQSKPKRLKIAIIILAVLLVLSAGVLAAQYIYCAFFAPTQATVTVPDNLIGEESTEPEATSRPAQADKPTAYKLELYKDKPEDNQRFEVVNMLPGDMVTKYFCIKAYHEKDIDLYFKADITEQTKSLGNVLHIKVTHMESGRVLCEAAFSEVKGKEFAALLKANSEKGTTVYYQIDVSLDTSVGNEYQVARLTADFEWVVKDEGGLTPPQTGDNINPTPWIVLAGSSFLLLLLLLGRRGKEDEQHGE